MSSMNLAQDNLEGLHSRRVSHPEDYEKCEECDRKIFKAEIVEFEIGDDNFKMCVPCYQQKVGMTETLSDMDDYLHEEQF